MSAVDGDKKAFYLEPKFLFGVMTFVNLLNFMDRGIIPGATNEFNTFIQKDLDTETPDVYLGLLQSSFVVGFVVGSLIFGHMIHHYGRFYLTGVGLSVWTVAVVLSGCSYFTGSYTFLVFSRMLSGFGEASLQCTVPPYIEATAPAGSRGTWLSIFFTAIPVGTAMGYAYSSIIAESAGWQFAFFIEAILMAPCVIFLFSIAPHFPCEHSAVAELSSEGSADSKTVRNVTQDSDQPATEDETHTSPPTVLEEFLAVTSRPVYLCLTAGYAAQTAALIGLSTFGSAFMMGLGYFDSESEASTVFGLLVSVAGLIGTILGGVLLDRLLTKNADDISVAEALESVAGEGGGGGRARRNSDDIMNTLLDPEAHPHHHGEAKEEHTQELGNITKLIACSSCVGVLALVLNYFVYDKGLFLFMTTLGCLFIFVCGSGINMGIMLSVPRKHRSFGIAIMAVCIHAFGDVPSPIIAGFLKDYLAPGCVPSSEDADDGNIASSDACRDDNHGLRVTMLVVNMWLLWTVVFFALAWWFNKTQRVNCNACVRGLALCGVNADSHGQQNYQSIGARDDTGGSRKAGVTSTSRHSGINSISHRASSSGSLSGGSNTNNSNSNSNSNTNYTSRQSSYENPRVSDISSGSGGGRNSSTEGAFRSSAGGPTSRPATLNPIVGENYNSYIANKRSEQSSQRSRSSDSQSSGRSVSGESAQSRTLRLSHSLKKSCSTEDLLSSFNIQQCSSLESVDIASRNGSINSPKKGQGAVVSAGGWLLKPSKSNDKLHKNSFSGDTVMV
jgi:MFS family permease